jgi:hypothetical protein
MQLLVIGQFFRPYLDHLSESSHSFTLLFLVQTPHVDRASGEVCYFTVQHAAASDQLFLAGVMHAFT